MSRRKWDRRDLDIFTWGIELGGLLAAVAFVAAAML